MQVGSQTLNFGLGCWPAQKLVQHYYQSWNYSFLTMAVQMLALGLLQAKMRTEWTTVQRQGLVQRRYLHEVGFVQKQVAEKSP